MVGRDGSVHPSLVPEKRCGSNSHFKIFDINESGSRSCEDFVFLAKTLVCC